MNAKTSVFICNSNETVTKTPHIFVIATTNRQDTMTQNSYLKICGMKIERGLNKWT